MTTIVNNIQFPKVNDVTLIQDTKTNKLMEVKYEYTQVDLGGSIEHYFTNNGKSYRIPQDSNQFKMYANLEAFERQLPLDMTHAFLDGSRTKGHFKFIADKDTRDAAQIVSYTFVNGLPTEVDAPVTGFKIVAHSGYHSIEPIFDDKVNLSDFFDSVENAIAFHDYVFTTVDGEEKTVKGNLSFILPTEEQQKIVDELRDVLNRAKEAGLGLMLNCAYGGFFAYDAKNARIDYDVDGHSLNDIEHLFPESIKLPNGIYDYNDDSCYRIFPIEEEA